MSLPVGPHVQRDRAVLSPGSLAWRYGLAVLAALVALGARSVIFPLFGDKSPYLPPVLAVMVSARFGGRWPGVVATVACALGITWSFVEPRHSIASVDPHAAASVVLFVIIALLISLLAGQLHESLLSSTRAERALRQETESINLSQDAIIAADANRRIMRWNAGAAQLYGAAQHEAVGRVLHDFLQTSGPVSITEINETLHRKGRWDGELSQVTRNGRLS